MEFTTLAREIGFETNYPWRLDKDVLIDWLASQGILLERDPANPTAQPIPAEKFLGWFDLETVKSRYKKDWQRVTVSKHGVLEIKKLFVKWMEAQ